MPPRLIRLYDVQMSSSNWLTITAVGILAVMAAAAADKPADLTLSDLDGKKVRLRDHRGRPVVLNFWATWCVPCRVEMPLLVEAEKQYRGRVVFIGASLDESKSRQRIPDFMKRFQMDFAVWTGATGDDLAKLGMGEAVPATAFIDAEGRILSRVSGQIRKEELDERLTWLVGDHSGAAPKPMVRHLDESK